MTIVLWAVLLFYCYILTMSARKVWDELPLLAQIVLVPPALVGWVLDWSFNILVATVIFWEWPRSLGEVLTKRLKRHRAHPLPSWRKRLSDKVCRVLNLFDQGHC